MIKNFAKDIFSNKKNGIEYLYKLSKRIDINIPQNINKLKSDDFWQFIEDNWSDISVSVVREMFVLSPKYNNGKNALGPLATKIRDFKNLFEKLKWGFSQSDCDKFLQRLNNNSDKSDIEKDKIASEAIIKNRRLKEINTLRNDYIEYLIFEKNPRFIPTIGHKEGVDFFIMNNGALEKWDQKVSKSVTNQFIKHYGKNWKEIAIKYPNIVAEYLYKFQSSERFDSNNRIFIVYLSDEINNNNIKDIISEIDLDNPYEIKFPYKIKGVTTEYLAKCYVILLY